MKEYLKFFLKVVVFAFAVVGIVLFIYELSDNDSKPTYHIEQSITQYNDSIFAVRTLVMSDDTLYQSRIGSYESFLGQVLVNEYQKAESILNYFRDKYVVQTYDKNGKIVIDTVRFKHLK